MTSTDVPVPAADLDVDVLAVADAAVAELRDAARASAAAQARMAAAIVAVADLGEDCNYESGEVAAVLAWTPRFASGEVAFSRLVSTDLPEVFEAWRAGLIDRHRASIFCDVLAFLLTDEHRGNAARIVALVLPKATGMTGVQLRAQLRNLVLKIDPAARKKQIERSITDRDLHLWPTDDGGTASLTLADLPAARAAAAFERVDAIARAKRAGGDGRTLNQLRADTALDLLDGIDPGCAPQYRLGIVELTIPLATAIGAAEAPGELAGYGPAVADVARQIAQARTDAQWRYSVTYQGELVYQGITKARPDGVTGSAPILDGPTSTGHAPTVHIAHPPTEDDPHTRFPGPKLKRWISARDRVCQSPGCHAAARVCDYDHTTDYADGGETCDANLALLCERHHREKHNGWWTVIQIRPGTLLWITPHGHIYQQLPRSH